MQQHKHTIKAEPLRKGSNERVPFHEDGKIRIQCFNVRCSEIVQFAVDFPTIPYREPSMINWTFP